MTKAVKTLYIRPFPGLTIPDPLSVGHLPPYGAAVDDTPYWRRRLREGSVERTTAEAIAQGAEAHEKACHEAALLESARLEAEKSDSLESADDSSLGNTNEGEVEDNKNDGEAPESPDLSALPESGDKPANKGSKASSAKGGK